MDRALEGRRARHLPVVVPPGDLPVASGDLPAWKGA
jgi:hypothetical protein